MRLSSMDRKVFPSSGAHTPTYGCLEYIKETGYACYSAMCLTQHQKCNRLYQATQRGNTLRALHLIRLTPLEVLQTSQTGRAVSIAAARYNRPDIIQALLQKGVNTHLCWDKTGYNTLGVASLYGNANMVELILSQSESDPNESCSVDGTTPLMCAAWKNHIAVADRLIQHGANVQKPHSTTGKTAIEYARQFHNQEMVLFLQSKCLPSTSEE